MSVARIGVVGAGGEELIRAGDDDAAHLGVGVEPLQRRGQLRPHLRREGVARLRPVQPHQADVGVVDRDLDQRRQAQLSCRGSMALIPVASRPMISFWICEVPS